MTGRISEDADAGALGGTELIPIVSGGVNKTSTPNRIATYLASFAQALANKSIDAANNTISNLAVSTFAAGVVDTDGTLAANSDTRIASQKAVKAYADTLIGANDAMVFKGVVDCSTNPNYPAADRGHTYKVSVAGKIGGASGINVEIGDTLICTTDGTASGTQAAVGASWTIIQANIDGAVTGPASSTSGNLATFNGTGGKVIQDSGVPISSLRLALTAARTYYVRTDGSDSNNGLANTAGGAFLTIQKAIDTVCAIDMGIYQVTIQVAAGTYTGQINFNNWVGSLRPIIQGDTVTPSNVVINVTGSDAIVNDAALPWQIQGFRVKTTTSGWVLRARNGGKIYFQNLDFAASADIQIAAQGAATIKALGNYSISGSPGGNGIHVYAADGAFVDVSGIGVTLTGTPAWSSNGMAFATRNGTLSANGITFTGSATGTRYGVTLNGVLYTAGGGASYFPGDAAGSTATGGQYA